MHYDIDEEVRVCVETVTFGKRVYACYDFIPW